MKRINFIIVLTIFFSQTFAQSKAIFVTKVGNGDPIIFLPGFITPGTVWEETIKNLKGKYESHMVSYAGFNGNAPIPMPWYVTIKKELINYVKSNNLKKIKLIGHSMGGNLATEMAAELGTLVDHVIIIDALACMRDVMMPGVPAEAIQYESPYNKQVLESSDSAFTQTATMMSQNMTDTKEKLPIIKSWILQADRKTYVYGYTDLLKVDLRPILATIKVPVLLIAAPFPNKAVVTETMNKQYETLTNKQLEVAPGGRHFIMFDQPQWLYDHINGFIGK
ncbi:MAG: alpha/beta hydrolase [Chryseolinea sp.]